MSDPVANVEIEDVLSSIRRLVTEDNRSEPAKVRLAEPDNADRLVLTPALRVPEPDEGDQPGTLDLDGYRAADSEASDDADNGDAIDLAEQEEQASAAHEDVDENPVVEEVPTDQGVDADDQGDVKTEPEDSAAPVNPTEPDTALAGDQEEPEDDLARDPPWKNRDSFLFQAAQLVEKTDAVKKARLEDEFNGDDQSSDISVSKPGPEPETGVVEDVEIENEVQSADQPDAKEDGVKETLKHIVAAPSEPEPGDLDDAPLTDDAESGHRVASLSAKIEALEAAIAETQDQWEPDGQVGDDYAGTPVDTIEWHDHEDDTAPDVEPVTQFRAQPRADHSSEISETVDTNGDPMPDETILDEESLRELVADIVREELQGALGERITRNVRKLVRREIHRALTAQELD